MRIDKKEFEMVYIPNNRDWDIKFDIVPAPHSAENIKYGLSFTLVAYSDANHPPSAALELPDKE